MFQTGRFDLKEIAVMGLFSTSRPLSARERKIAALKSMSAAELADIGLKPGDVALLERAMRGLGPGFLRQCTALPIA